MRVVEDSFKLPSKSIIDYWNGLHCTSAFSFHRHYVKPLDVVWAFYVFFSLLQKQAAPWNSDLRWTGPRQRLCWGLWIPSPVQPGELWKVYTFLAYLCFVMGLTWNYLLPTPSPSREPKSRWIVTVFWSWSPELLPWSNNFVSGCKKVLQEEKKKGKSSEIQNVSPYWGDSPRGFNFGARSRSPSPFP